MSFRTLWPLFLLLNIFSINALADQFRCPPMNANGPPIVFPQRGFNSFYSKAIKSDGIQVVSSSKTCDRSLQIAHEIVRKMLSSKPEIETNLIRKRAFVAVFSISEKLTDLPENRDLAGKPTGADPSLTFDDLCGGGGVNGRPTAICERNLIGVNDPFFGRMSVLIHEFGHTIQNLGLNDATLATIEIAYANALALHLFPKANGIGVSWMMSNVSEFFAEASGTWFNAADPTNPVNSPEEIGRSHLKRYAPKLYQILSMIYPDDNWVYPRK
jgi:hypothetical protein